MSSTLLLSRSMEVSLRSMLSEPFRLLWDPSLQQGNQVYFLTGQILSEIRSMTKIHCSWLFWNWILYHAHFTVSCMHYSRSVSGYWGTVSTFNMKLVLVVRGPTGSWELGHGAHIWLASGVDLRCYRGILVLAHYILRSVTVLGAGTWYSHLTCAWCGLEVRQGPGNWCLPITITLLNVDAVRVCQDAGGELQLYFKLLLSCQISVINWLQTININRQGILSISKSNNGQKRATVTIFELRRR